MRPRLRMAWLALAALAWLRVSPAASDPGEPGTAADRLARTVETALTASPRLEAVLARIRVDAADARQAGAPGAPWLEADARDRSWIGSGAPDGMRRIRLGVPFRYPWQWPGRWALEREVAAWTEAGERAARLEVVRTIADAWLERAAAVATAGIAARLGAREDEVLATETARIQQGLAAPVDRIWVGAERSRAASRQLDAEVDGAAAAAEIARLAGEPGEVAEGDLLDLLSATRSPAGREAELRERMRQGALFAAAEGEADRDRAEGRVRMAEALGTPRVEVGIRQDVDGDLVAPDLSALVSLRVPIPVGRAVRQERAEGAARVAEAEHVRDDEAAGCDARLAAALAGARAGERLLAVIVPVLDGLSEAEAGLAAQYGLREISGPDYVRDLDRLARVRLDAVDVARKLLRARLELAVLLEDPALFPPVFAGGAPRGTAP